MTSAFASTRGEACSARVELLDRQRPEHARLRSERLAHALAAAGDPPLELREAAVLEQIVELLQRADLRHRHEVAATVAADLAFDAALLVGALLARPGEGRLEQVVGAQRDEPVLLDPPAAAQHLLDRRAQVVVADQREGAAEEAERLHVRLQERLLRLPLEGDHERGARVAGAHQEQVHRAPLPGDLDDRLAPVDLRLDTRLVHLRHEHLVHRLAQLAPAHTHIAAHLPSPTPRPRAPRRAAARPASPCAAAYAAPPDPPTATSRSAADAGPASAPDAAPAVFRGGGNGEASACRTARR